MSKGIHKVRKSIQQRKNKRLMRSVQQSEKTERLIRLPNDEEKHGYISNVEPYTPKKRPANSRIPSVLMKAMIAISLFFAVAIVMQSNQPYLNTAKTWTSHALTNDFPFAQVHAWYTDTFGSPLGFEPKLPVTNADDPSFQLPVGGNVTEHFQSNGTGVLITPEDSEDVHAWEAGIIVFVGKKKDTNKTIVIQHADGGKTTYGNMSATDVHLYQHVVKNQQIGSFDIADEEGSVFFSLERENSFIDPIQVIKVDDRP